MLPLFTKGKRKKGEEEGEDIIEIIKKEVFTRYGSECELWMETCWRGVYNLQIFSPL
jgi:hypothetical protein